MLDRMQTEMTLAIRCIGQNNTCKASILSIIMSMMIQVDASIIVLMKI